MKDEIDSKSLANSLTDVRINAHWKQIIELSLGSFVTYWEIISVIQFSFFKNGPKKFSVEEKQKRFIFNHTNETESKQYPKDIQMKKVKR